MKMNSKTTKDILKTLITFLLGIGILWVLYRKTDFNELWEIVKGVNFKIIAGSLIFGLIGNVLRGLRWGLFLKAFNYNPKTQSIVFATLGNYAVNYLLPRAGDFWRCGVVSKFDKIPFGKTFETFLVDKVLDLIMSIFILVLSIALSFDFFISYFKDTPEYTENLKNMLSSIWLYVLVGLLVLAFVLLFTTFKHTVFVKKIKSFFKEIKRDLILVAHMKDKRKIILYTILLWLCFYLYFYICFFAFDFTNNLGWVAGLIVFAMSNVGVAVPVQGGMGAWHFMVISSLIILGVSNANASAFAFAVFAIQSLWTILYGLVGVVAMPYVKRNNIITETPKDLV
ncbi:MAG: lysylphosphatidylglycerol synthase transmembrane domain-containing protein [Dysgonamonadaceae bacterium]|jgi:hypothetical protein|nr:lysylphosphatidylglycerol synthase transmembrane domain-containing protein [Dysgonamonadaceae bacterium]MDD4398623.1 lysylphosphatidylglycerol synthase transmembrane domain-containing protein [Dysgonamonadaceae bacterium]